MNKLKKLISCSILFLTFISFSSCKNDSNKNETKLELWTMQLKPTFNDYMNGVISNFEKDNPNINVEWVDLPAKDIDQKSLTSIASGNSPDIINLNPTFSSKLASLDVLVNLEPVIDSEVKNRYFEKIWYVDDNKKEVYGFPWYLSTAITIYNKDIFEKASIKELPKSFSDLKLVGTKIKQKTDKYVFIPNLADSGKILEYMVQEGIQLVSNDKKTAVFNNKKAADFIDFWKELVTLGLIPQNSITQGHREVIDRFQSGESSLLVTGPQFLKIIKENAPKLYEKVGVYTQLTGESGKISVGVMNLVIPKKTKNFKEAAKLAQFITNDTNQLAFSKIVTILPSVKKANQDEFFTKTSNESLDQVSRSISSKQLEKAQVLLPPLKNKTKLNKVFDKYFQQAFLGQISSKEALDKAKVEWDKILQSN